MQECHQSEKVVGGVDGLQKDVRQKVHIEFDEEQLQIEQRYGDYEIAVHRFEPKGIDTVLWSPEFRVLVNS